MKKIDLCGKWTVINEKIGKIQGNVPGCITTDLIKAGKVYGENEIPENNNIFYRDNAKKIQWIERENFTYERNFNVPTDEKGEIEKNARLVFECLDTYTNIYLNGLCIGKTDDMHIKYEFDVDGIIKKGKNTIKIEFKSPVEETENLVKRPAAFTAERLYSRREQCTYGWDWVYRFVTCGIERPCYIEFQNKPYVENAYIYTMSADKETAQVKALVKIKNYRDTAYVNLQVIDEKGNVVYKNNRFVAEEYFTEYISIDNPELWYPNGYGKQPLYTLKIAVSDKNLDNISYNISDNISDNILYKEGYKENFEEKFGIRTVKILQKKDKPGTFEYEMSKFLQNTESGKEYDKNGDDTSSFTLCINDKKIMCMGGNWVPCSPFVSEEKDNRITKILTMAKNAGLNMIRVWGGGVFEKDHFYSECDRLGILVTQDFLMACGKYPEEKAQFLERLSKEAECAAIRLRNHPCLVWWSGDNENAVNGYESLESFNGRESALKAIAPKLRELDYNRHFLPSSPYGGKMYASKTFGTTHNTQFLGNLFPYMLAGNATDYKENYKNYLARFIAEEPSCGAITPISLKEIMTEEDIYGDDESMWLFHTQSNPGLPEELFTYTRKYAEGMLGKFENGQDKVFKLRYLQCEWVRIGMEMVRRNMFYSSGIIYWMLNECWPAASGWAFIDYYCRYKDGMYSFKKCAGNVISSIDKSKGDKENGKFSIYISNKQSSNAKCLVKLYKIDYKTGKILSSSEISANVPKESSKAVYSFEDTGDEKLGEKEIYVADLYVANKFAYRTFYKDGALEMTKSDSVEIVEKKENSITIKSNGYVQNIFIDGDIVPADNDFTMIPGETKKVKIVKNNSKPFGATYTTDEINVTAYVLK